MRRASLNTCSPILNQFCHNFLTWLSAQGFACKPCRFSEGRHPRGCATSRCLIWSRFPPMYRRRLADLTSVWLAFLPLRACLLPASISVLLRVCGRPFKIGQRSGFVLANVVPCCPVLQSGEALFVELGSHPECFSASVFYG